MEGIDLNRSVEYQGASFRFFMENEYHITRVCRDDVLLLVFDGVLRFTEDGSAYAIRPGEYHIQRHGSRQSADCPSDAPKYLYIHFRGHWAEGPGVLPRSGKFDPGQLMPLMEAMDALAHSDATLVCKCAKFYELLTLLNSSSVDDTPAHAVAAYLRREFRRPITLALLCREFHFSKNHIINLFRKTFGTTPIPYLNRLRLGEARHRMEVTSESIEHIALQCGFSNYSHFYRLFKREHGLSPEQWRVNKRLGTD